MTTPTKMFDQQEYIIDWLTRNGPSRCKPMHDTASPRIRTNMSQQLDNMYRRGEIDRRQDGLHKGKQVWLYALPGVWDSAPAPAAVSFNARDTLSGFQAAAREQLGIPPSYLERIGAI